MGCYHMGEVDSNGEAIDEDGCCNCLVKYTTADGAHYGLLDPGESEAAHPVECTEYEDGLIYCDDVAADGSCMAVPCKVCNNPTVERSRRLLFTQQIVEPSNEEPEPELECC